MIQTAEEMRLAIKRNRFTGVILYEGPSHIDGAPIVVIANRIVAPSTNDKTGAMVQTKPEKRFMAPAIRTDPIRAAC